MFLISLRIFIIYLLFHIYNFNLYSQDVLLLGNIKYGSKYSELGNNININSAHFSDLIPDDIEIDYENNIYLCDRFTKRIFKFNPALKLIYVEKINDVFFKADNKIPTEFKNLKETFYDINLETDKAGNLYVLISIGELFHNLIKFDKNGNVITDFNLKDQQPTQRLTKFFISSFGNIFINTFPLNPQNLTHSNDGTVFVYNLNGDFLGRTDYYIEDNIGNVYKRNLLNANQFQLDSFNSENNHKIKLTSEIEQITSLKTDYLKDKAWYFLGIDNFNNIYFIQGRESLLIKKFNFKKNNIEEIQIKKDIFSKKNILFVNNFCNISLAPDGVIYICGINSNSGKKLKNDKIKVDDSSISILKINY